MFSYQNLFCILPYMEANQRILLTARCPSLSTVNQNTVFRLKRVKFEHHKVTLNKISYEVIERKVQICGPHPEDVQNFGDIALDGFREAPSHEREILEVKFQRGPKSARKRIPDYYRGVPVAVRRLIGTLLGGRQQVIVDYLEFNFGNDPTLVRMPSGLKFHVRNFDVGVHDLDSFLPLLAETSYPLNGLKITDPDELRHSVLQEARTLAICQPDFHNEDLLGQFQRLPNKRIMIKSGGISVPELLRIVNYWVNNEKEIGNRLWVPLWDQARVEEFVEMAKEKFNGSYVKLMERDERQLPNSKCASIPITLDSELIIYGTGEKQPGDAVWHYNIYKTIVVKVMPVGSTKPVEPLVPAPKATVGGWEPRPPMEQNSQGGKSRKSKFLRYFKFK